LTKEDEETKKQEAVQALEQAKLDEVKVVTTEEELEGFMIVKTILRQKISATRITHRDAQSYFAILLDDNNRKTICRLYLNGSKKFFVILDDQKKEVKNEINTLDDIFKHSETLLKSLTITTNQKNQRNRMKEAHTPNSTYKKLAVQCHADSFVVSESFVLRMNICGENRQLQDFCLRWTWGLYGSGLQRGIKQSSNTFQRTDHWHFTR
jgi:hypothetical protein